MIPQVEPCRFMTIAQIRQKVADDDFQYNSVRVVGKVVQMIPQAYKLLAEDPNDSNQTITVEHYLLKHRDIQKGKVYEFLGEIEKIEKGADQAQIVGGAANRNNGAI